MTFHAVCNSSKWMNTKERVDSESLKRVVFKTNPKTIHIDVNIKH